ncbi:MAG: protein kinase [Chitinivibrionales bacterium]|nr:protein kinase [Chitinivibrionales bacterium]
MSKKQARDSGQAQRFGRYRVEGLLGEGGMGKVYLAHDPVLGRPVAIKAVSFDLCLDETSRHEYTVRFTTEARASAKLNHPSVVAVYDAGEEEGTPWIAFELVDGEGLDRVLAREQRLPVDNAVAIATDIASALDHAHSLGIVHRDVKPSNVLIDTRTGTAKLADFGVVRTPWSQVTQEGQAVGSPGYMSPEQIEGSDLDGRSDVFSLSIVLYQMVTGQHPFLRETLQGTCFATVSGTYQPLHVLAPEAPKALQHLIDAGLTPHCEKRLESAHAMAQGLRRIPAGSAELSHDAPKTSPEDEPVSVRRRFRPVISLAVAAGRRAHRFMSETGLFCTNLCGIGSRSHDTSTGAVLGRQARRGFARMADWCRMQVIRLAPLFQRLRSRTPALRLPGRQVAAALVFVVAVAVLAIRVQVLQRRVTEAGLTESLTAAKTLERYPFVDGYELLLAQADSAIVDGELDSARAILTRLLTTEGVTFRAHALLALLEWLDGDENRSEELLGRVAGIADSRREYRSHRKQVFGILERILRQGSCDAAVQLIAEELQAADSRAVKAWLGSPDYWLRWNAVCIREAAGLAVDSVGVYLLDLAHGGSMRTRTRAARKLGELGDKRAVPGLKAARDRGWQDPFVAAAAGAALEQLGVSDDG